MKERIIKRGFELLKTRPLDEKINIEIIQNDYGIKLPPQYCFFANVFKVGEPESNVAYITPDKVKQYCAGIFYDSKSINNEEVMFDNFLTIESTISSFEADDDWLENGYLPLGTCGHGGAILIGTKGDDLDCVLLQSNTGEIKFLNKNIFDFVRSLILQKVPEEELLGNVKFSELYKNWGEDFWRVRKNEII